MFAHHLASIFMGKLGLSYQEEMTGKDSSQRSIFVWWAAENTDWTDVGDSRSAPHLVMKLIN